MSTSEFDSRLNVVDDRSTMDSPLLLSEHVRLAVRDFVTRLDGDEIHNLYDIVLNEVERPLILTVLDLCNHNQSKTAQMLGLSRSTLRKKLASYGPL